MPSLVKGLQYLDVSDLYPLECISMDSTHSENGFNRFWFMMRKNFAISTMMLIQTQRAGMCIMPGIIFSSFGLNEKTLFLGPSALVGCFALPGSFIGV